MRGRQVSFKSHRMAPGIGPVLGLDELSVLIDGEHLSIDTPGRKEKKRQKFLVLHKNRSPERLTAFAAGFIINNIS